MISASVLYMPRLMVLFFCVGLALIPANAQTGMFVPGTVYTPPLRPLYVLTGDYNGDNIQDIVVFSDEGTGVPGNAYVLLGNGDGTFHPATSYPLGTAGFGAPSSPSQGILVINNNTHIEDLVVPIVVSNTVSVLLGKGDGSFSPFASYTVDNQPTAAVVADTDGTAYPELAVVADGAGRGITSSVSILLGHDDGTFAPTTIIPLADSSPTSISSGYFRHGVFNTDLAIGTSKGVAVLLGNGHGTFQPEVDYPLSSPVTSVATSDFNGDSFPDLAATHGNIVSILLGNGDGTFQPPTDYVVGNGALSIFVARALLASDLNGDHNDDLVVANYADNTFSVLLGNGDGTFQPALTFPVNGTGPSSIAVANFNNDGAPDLVVTTQSGATPGSPGSAFVFLNTRGHSETVTCSPNLVQFGQSTTCTATLSPVLPGVPVPTGNVAINISNAAFSVCSGSLDATGKMQCQGGSSLGIGGWGVKADYSGDKNHNPGSFYSSTVLDVDELNFNPSNSVSSTVSAGQTAQFAVWLSAMAGYGGPVTLMCTGAPMGAACSVPSSVQLPAQINAMVSTTSRTMAAVQRSHSSAGLWVMGLATLVLLPGACGRKRRLGQIAKMLPLWLLMLLGSCGGNSGSTTNPNGTPAGTYAMTLTATAGGLKTSVPMMLTVK